MTVSISTQARNDAGDAIVDLIDGGSTNPNGVMEIRTGSKPASPQAVASGTLLATLNFSNPAFGNFSNGNAFANAIADDSDVDATGQAGWFRIYDRDGTAVIDGEITATGGGGDIEFDNIDFIKGGTVAIAQLQAVMPQ
jgi:hypothetical protein